MINSVVVPELRAASDLTQSRVVCNHIQHVRWVVAWLEPHYLEMIVFERQQVLTPPCFLVLHQTVALHSHGVVHDDIVAIS